VDPLAELKLAVARLKERLDALSPEEPASEEKLSLMHDIRSLAAAQGALAARRFFDRVVADGKLSPSEFEGCFQ